MRPTPDDLEDVLRCLRHFLSNRRSERGAAASQDTYGPSVVEEYQVIGEPVALADPTHLDARDEPAQEEQLF
jgi:hypothetical protein